MLLLAGMVLQMRVLQTDLAFVPEHWADRMLLLTVVQMLLTEKALQTLELELPDSTHRRALKQRLQMAGRKHQVEMGFQRGSFVLKVDRKLLQRVGQMPLIEKAPQTQMLKLAD